MSLKQELLRGICEQTRQKLGGRLKAAGENSEQGLKNLLRQIEGCLILPLIRKYSKQETTAGRHLGESGHSGSTESDIRAYEAGRSILLNRIQFWREKLGKDASDTRLLTKLSGDALILFTELILRKIRESLDLKSAPLKYQLLVLVYYGLAISKLRLYESVYDFKPNISGITLIGHPSSARYEAEYVIYGDLEAADRAIKDYYRLHAEEEYTIDGITATISCEGDAILILIRDGVIEGEYTIKMIE